MAERGEGDNNEVSREGSDGLVDKRFSSSDNTILLPCYCTSVFCDHHLSNATVISVIGR